MHSDYYHLPQIFEKEKQYLTQNCWLLVAHKNELLNNFDFVTYDFFDERMFIQNFEGTIKAFQNICIHRFNAIHASTHGNRPPICHYHNWAYNTEGKPYGIPNKSGFNESEIANLCLKQYEVALCGSFVFVKPYAGLKTSLKEYLGDFFEDFVELSSYFGKKAADFFMPHASNWKLALENVLECYHCPCVHKNTFAKIGYGFSTITNHKTHNGTSYAHNPKKEPEKKNAAYEKIVKASSYKYSGYLHYYIFPNTNITCSDGVNFYMGSVLPQNSSSHNLRIRNFSGTFSDAENKLGAMIDYVTEQSTELLTTILNEDRVVLESIQTNISLTNRVPLLGKDEIRVRNFHEFISKNMYE